MTHRIKNIITSINKALTTINVLLFGFATWIPVDIKMAKQKKVPLIFNIILLLLLLFAMFIMTYGAYRRANS